MELIHSDFAGARNQETAENYVTSAEVQGRETTERDVLFARSLCGW